MMASACKNMEGRITFILILLLLGCCSQYPAGCPQLTSVGSIRKLSRKKSPVFGTSEVPTSLRKQYDAMTLLIKQLSTGLQKG
jgi:hypothetical protein